MNINAIDLMKEVQKWSEEPNPDTWVILASNIDNPDEQSLKNVLNKIKPISVQRINSFIVLVNCPQLDGITANKYAVNWTLHPQLIYSAMRYVH